MTAIRIGVSSCLIGERVRYDGGDKIDRFVTGVLGRFTTLVPVCPEVESGMPVPREAMRLEGEPESPRLVTLCSRIDMTGLLTEFCRSKVAALEREDLSGFVLKKDSPSCGLCGVKIYRDGVPVESGSGLFAAAIKQSFPDLPLVDEARLEEPQGRDHFIECVFAYRRFSDLLLTAPAAAEVLAFHSRHKLIMMAHSPVLYRETGSLIARAGELEMPELLRRYRALFMEAMATPATVAKHTNVLQHAMGYFKRQLDSAAKQELAGLIVDYHDGLVPLIAPVTLLRHYAVQYDDPYLKQQLYLFPDPAEKMLRNHV